MRIAPLWKSAVFAAVTVASQGFGAAQALAAPPAPAGARRERTGVHQHLLPQDLRRAGRQLGAVGRPLLLLRLSGLIRIQAD